MNASFRWLAAVAPMLILMLLRLLPDMLPKVSDARQSQAQPIRARAESSMEPADFTIWRVA